MTKFPYFAFTALIVTMSAHTSAHYPYVAPLSYQTFNNHTAILAGFYDNPFASEVAIKKFEFQVTNPNGQVTPLTDNDWAKTKSVASYSLENKIDGTYRIQGQKISNTTQYVLDQKQWKTLLKGMPQANKIKSDQVVYSSQLTKNAQVKTVQAVELIETFVSRNHISDQRLKTNHLGFEIQFLTHPNAVEVGQNIQFKLMDQGNGIVGQKVEILMQTNDFSRDEKVVQTVVSNAQGELNFVMKEKGQYLLKVDYQQGFDQKQNDLKRFKYTLSFNVID